MSIQSLRQIPLLADTPEEFLVALLKNTDPTRLKKRKTLTLRNESALIVTLSGSLDVISDTQSVMDTLDPGDYLGEGALFDPAFHEISLRSVENSEFLIFQHSHLQTTLNKFPDTKAALEKAYAALKAPMQETAAKPGGHFNTRIFISYSRKDKDFVHSLHEQIKTHNIDPWVDWENIPLTVDWWTEIERGIQNADAFAFVMSPDSLTSKVCMDELDTAVRSNKRLIPILHRDPEPDNPMHHALSSHNWVMMHNLQEIETHLPEMLEVINTDLDYVRSHTRLLQRAMEWQDAGHSSSFSLRGEDLKAAENWLEKSKSIENPKPVRLQEEYIRSSRRETRRRNSLLAASILIFIVIVSLGLAAFSQRNIAQQERNIAQQQRNIAQSERDIAATQRAIAEENEQLAKDNESKALTARAEADKNAAEALENREEALQNAAEAEAARAAAEESEQVARQQEALALEQAEIARSAQLAAQAQNIFSDQPAASLLVSLESLNIIKALEGVSSFDALSSLLTGLLRSSQATSLQPEKTLTEPNGFIKGVAIRSDGVVAAGNNNRLIYIWDSQGNLIQTVRSNKAVNDLVFSPDGRFLVAATTNFRDQPIQVWDMSDLSAIESNEMGLKFGEGERRHIQSVESIRFSADGKILASGSDDWTIRLWDMENLRRGASVEQIGDTLQHPFKTPITGVAFSPDGKYIAGGACRLENSTRRCWKGLVLVWSVDTQELIDTLEVDSREIQAVAFSPDGKILASGGEDGSIILWDIRNNPLTILPVQTLEAHDWAVTSLAFSSDGRLLASGSVDDAISLWDAQTFQRISKINRHQSDIDTLAFLPEPKLGQEKIVTGSFDSNVILWNVTYSQQIGAPFGRLEDGITSSAYHTDQMLILGDASGGITLWPPRDGPVSEPVRTQISSAAIVSLSIDPGRQEVYSVDAKGSIRRWAFSALQAGNQNAGEVVEVPIAGFPVALAAGEMVLASVGEDNDIEFRDLESGDQIAPFNIVPQGKVTALALDASGQRLAVAVCAAPEGNTCPAGNASIELWETAAGIRSENILAGHTNTIQTLAFHPTETSWLFSGGLDRTIVLWDVDRGLRLGQPFIGHTSGLQSLVFLQDGETLLSGEASGIIIRWQTSRAEWERLACDRAQRNLTEAEWRQYFNKPYRQTCEQFPAGD